MLRKLASPFKEFGWFAGLLYSLDRALQRLSPNIRLYFYELLVQPIPDAALLPAKLARTLEMRQISRGDPEIALMPARPEIKEARFRQNAICLGTFRQDELIGYIWFSFDLYEEDEVRCDFVLPADNQSVFDFDLYLFPESRMGLGFAGIWNGANQFLRSRGIKASFSRLTRVNVASRRAHRKIGAKVIAYVLVLKVWTVEVLVSTVSPFVHLSASGRDRVRLKLKSEPSEPLPAAEDAATL